MKNAVFFVLISVLCCLVLAGCHGAVEQNEFVVPKEFDTGKNYEITFWAKNDTNLTQVAIYNDAISEFESIYPNIKVNLRLYTDYRRIYNDVITNISTGTTPNVCITYPDHIATYITGENVVVPLDSLMEHEEYGLGGSKVNFDAPKKEEIIAGFLKECYLGGNCYALPFMRSTEACYVNKTYVEKLGFTLPETLTWDFVWQVCEKACEKDSDGNYILNGQKVLLPFIYKSTDNMMIQMLYQKEAGYSTEKGEILIFNDTAREILTQIAGHTKNGAFSTFKISGYPANFLNAGQCIFAVDSTAGATWMGSNAPLVDISRENLAEFETQVMTVPQFDTENPKMISQGPSVCIFNKEDSGEVLASWLFVQYLLTNRVQIAYSQTEGYVPVTAKAHNSEEYTDYISRSGQDNSLYYDIKIKASRLMTENIDKTFVTPVFNGSASLRDAAGQMIESVTKSVRRHEEVDDGYLDALFEDVTSLYRLDRTGSSHQKQTLGNLPFQAVLLLAALGISWLFIIAYAVVKKVKDTKNSSNY
ncbi:MAG: extracellular solute-binding protein [Clostridia bacterium]|nr:extracellular solute-binding protein [Clostridia bacterium]